MKLEILCSTIRKLMQLSMICFLLISLAHAQQNPSPEVKKKVQQAYNNIKNPEISFDKFLQINSHVYAINTGNISRNGQTPLSTAALAAPQDPYCSKARPYCGNGDFESGLDQNQYTGAYGFWTQDLYPNPFSLTYGFSSGPLSDPSAHQTIVNKSQGNDPITGIALTPSNGGNQSLRLGNTATGAGTELIAKTIVVDPNETILNFYYAPVLQDPGHAHNDAGSEI